MKFWESPQVYLTQTKGTCLSLTSINQLSLRRSLHLDADLPEERLRALTLPPLASSSWQHVHMRFPIWAVTAVPPPSQSHTHSISSASQDPPLRGPSPGPWAPLSSSLSNTQTGPWSQLHGAPPPSFLSSPRPMDEGLTHWDPQGSQPRTKQAGEWQEAQGWKGSLGLTTRASPAIPWPSLRPHFLTHKNGEKPGPLGSAPDTWGWELLIEWHWTASNLIFLVPYCLETQLNSRLVIC